MLIILYVYLIVSSLLLSMILVPLAKKLAIRWNIHDQPGERKIHFTPKPYLGGVAIFLSFIIVLLVNLVLFMVLKDHAYIQSNFSFLADQYSLLINVWPRLSAILSWCDDHCCCGCRRRYQQHPDISKIEIIVADICCNYCRLFWCSYRLFPT